MYNINQQTKMQIRKYSIKHSSCVIMAGLKTSQTGASNCENLVNASIVWSLYHIMCVIWHKPYSYIICAIWAHYFGNDSHVRGCWISWWSPHLKTLHWSEIKRVLDWHHSSKNVWRWLKLSLIHIWRCRRIERCRSRWSPYH